MKKLLEEAMSKETQSKQRPPSIIARLMGLDGLPPRQSARKQPKKATKSDQQRTAFEGSRINTTSSDCRTSRRSSKNQQEFKDVYEVLETSKVKHSSYPPKRTEKSRLPEAEMAFIRQKFMVAKHLSTDENLQNSKEFHDALEVLDSNRELLLKFLQHPNSLLTKHTHDLSDAPRQRHRGTSSNALKNTSRDRLCIQEREGLWKNKIISPDSLHNHSFASSHTKHGTYVGKSSRIGSDFSDETTIAPTRIVVLKPNLAKLHNSVKCTHPSDFSFVFPVDCRTHKEYPSLRCREREWEGKKGFSDDTGISRYKSRESRDCAKQITRRLKRSPIYGDINLYSSGFGGYAGDESSCCVSGNNSGNESEVSTTASFNVFDQNHRHRRSLSCSSDSSVAREAKKRLSDRWNTTHRSLDMAASVRGSTLGEMLAIPDKKMEPVDMETIYQGHNNDCFDKIGGTLGHATPLGISSRDGWKNVRKTNVLRSKSRSASPDSSRIPRTRVQHEANDRVLIEKEASNCGRKMAMKGNMTEEEALSMIFLRSSSQNPQTCCCTDEKDKEPLLEINFCQKEVRSKNEDPLEWAPDSEENPITNISNAGAIQDAAKNKNLALFPEIPDQHLPALSDYMLVPDSSILLEGDSVKQAPSKSSNGPTVGGPVLLNGPINEPESPASSKEADQPSPVSVLEAPFTDDVSSSSECFGSLNADLQGLRMQLQLLKMESEAYAEGPMALSSDEEEAAEGSSGAVFKAGESWESSYVAAVLTDAGFDGAGPDTFPPTWISSDCPIDPSVFGSLEKKYCDGTASTRSEKKLLFDRINSALAEIFRPFMRLSGFCPRRSKETIEHDLCKLLSSQKRKTREEGEEAPGVDSKWLDLGEHIDFIGEELERMLSDELIDEAMAM